MVRGPQFEKRCSIGIKLELQLRKCTYCEVETESLYITHIIISRKVVKGHYMPRLTKTRALFVCHLFCVTHAGRRNKQLNVLVVWAHLLSRSYEGGWGVVVQ